MSIKGDYIAYSLIASVRPGIRGRVYLKNADAFTDVGIDMDYPRDPQLQRLRLKQFLTGIELFERLDRTESFRRMNMKFGQVDVPGCNGSWECVISYMTLVSFIWWARAKWNRETIRKLL